MLERIVAQINETGIFENFITQTKLRELITKIEKFVSEHQAKRSQQIIDRQEKKV